MRFVGGESWMLRTSRKDDVVELDLTKYHTTKSYRANLIRLGIANEIIDHNGIKFLKSVGDWYTDENVVDEVIVLDMGMVDAVRSLPRLLRF